MYHGILIDQEFTSPLFPESFKVFSTKQDGDWKIYGIEIQEIGGVIENIQKNMKSNAPWYAHLYNNKELIVIFKNKIFKLKPNKNTWDEAIQYGKSLGIPERQLDFQPNTFSGEKSYFE